MNERFVESCQMEAMQEQEDTMTPVLKQQLQQCEMEIRNVMKAIRQGIITDTTKECLEELEEQRDSLKASIAQLALERRKFTKEEIIDIIIDLRSGPAIQACQFTLRVVVHALMTTIFLGQCIIYVTTIILVIR